MFNIVLRLFLYLILAVCIGWGLILISGPQFIKFFANKTYGDNLRIYDLRVTPKLDLAASRIEFSDVSLTSNDSVAGSIRGVRLSWTFGDKFFPEVILNTGPIFLNDVILLKNSRVDFGTSNLWSTGSLDFSFNGTSINYPETATVESISAFGVYDYRSFELKDIGVHGKELVVQKNLKFKVPSFDGTIKNAKLDNNYRPVSIIQTKLNLEEIILNNLSVTVGSINADYAENNDGGLLELYTDYISDKEKSIIAEDIEITAGFSPDDIVNSSKITLNSRKILLPPLPYYNDKSSIKNFSTVVENEKSDGYHALSKGSFDSFEVSTGDSFLVNLSGADFSVSAKLESNRDSAKSLVSKIYLNSNSKPAVVLDGTATFLLSETDYLSCFFSTSCASKIKSNYLFKAGEAKLKGSSYCDLPDCIGNDVKHVFESDNTVDFFESALSSKIFNPFLLAFIHSSFSKGQKVGNGHILKF